MTEGGPYVLPMIQPDMSALAYRLAIAEQLLSEFDPAALQATLTALAQTIAGKADATAVTAALAGKVDGTVMATALAAKADASALDGKADAAIVSKALAAKADSTALDAKADAATTTRALAAKVDTAAMTTALAAKADATAVPKIATMTPQAEAAAGAAGQAASVSAADHIHPRLTSATYTSLQANGLSQAVTFTRTFAVKPAVLLTAITPGGTAPVQLQVDSWIMAGTLYAGCVVKGYRGSVPTLAAVTVAGISVAAGTGQNLNSYAGSVAGIEVSVVALARSDG